MSNYNITPTVITPNTNELYIQAEVNNKYYIQNQNLREFVSEFFGMYWFILTSLGNIAIIVNYPDAYITWTGVAISWGMNLMFGIYIASFNSKAHLNPCVTLCMFLFEGGMTVLQLWLYTLAQLLGAFVAAITIYGIYYEKLSQLNNDKTITSIFVTYENPAINHTSAFFTEFIGTALLVGGIFIILSHKHTQDMAAIYIGLLLSSLVLSVGYQSAFAFNPARDLGPRILMACLGYDSFIYANHYWWVPLVADYCGAVFGTLVVQLFIKQQITE